VKHRGVKIAIVVFWLCMTAWLVRFEAFPEHFTHSLEGYKSLLSRDILLMDSWMKIMFKGAPVGYTHTSMDSSESTPLIHCTINNRTDLKVRFMGESRVCTMNASVGLDSTYRLQNFSCSLGGGGFSANVNGARTSGRAFNVDIKLNGNPYNLVVDLPDDAILYSPMTAMNMKRMKVGQEVRVPTLDPITMKKTNVIMKAVRQESLTVAGEKCETTVLSTDYHGKQFLTWIDSTGNVVKQVTPLGWTMEKCSAKEAFEAFRDSEGGEDVLSTVTGLLSWQV
jgi:hypothetical protein